MKLRTYDRKQLRDFEKTLPFIVKPLVKGMKKGQIILKPELDSNWARQCFECVPDVPYAVVIDNRTYVITIINLTMQEGIVGGIKCIRRIE